MGGIKLYFYFQKDLKCWIKTEFQSSKTRSTQSAGLDTLRLQTIWIIDQIYVIVREKDNHTSPLMRRYAEVAE